MDARPAERMAGVVAAVQPTLRTAGFRKRRHVFNRTAEAGLVHVLGFQMGAFDPPGTVPVPPWRRNLYGRYTINLGVYLDEVARALTGRPREGFVPEYECEIRVRIGQLTRPAEDLWLDLDRDPEALASEATVLIEDLALPFLDGLADRESILAAWDRGTLAAAMAPRAPLAVAVILDGQGRTADARQLTRAYLERTDHAPGHHAWAEQRARELGLA